MRNGLGIKAQEIKKSEKKGSKKRTLGNVLRKY
jgi:hypothetical protein